MTVAATALAATDGGAAARLERLCDPATFRPLRFAVGDAVLAGTGLIAGRPVYAWAQRDAGSGDEAIERAVALADRIGAPVVGLALDGVPRPAGALLRTQARATVPQVTVVAGTHAGAAVWSPALGDVTIAAGDDARMFLGGPQDAARIVGEDVTAEALGGAGVHARTGVAQLLARDADHAADLVRALLGFLPQRAGEPLPAAPALAPEPGDPGDVLPQDPHAPYDVRAVARRLVDAGDLLELGPRWARNLVTGLARLEGRPVGVLASQPRHLGGYVDAHAADKGAWFVDLCDRFGLPLLVLADTPGLLPGTGQERAGAIRRSAALVRAFAVASVPCVTVVLRGTGGGTDNPLDGRLIGAQRVLAWPAAGDDRVDEILVPSATRGSVCAVLGANA